MLKIADILAVLLAYLLEFCGYGIFSKLFEFSAVTE